MDTEGNYIINIWCWGVQSRFRSPRMSKTSEDIVDGIYSPIAKTSRRENFKKQILVYKNEFKTRKIVSTSSQEGDPRKEK
jgi:type IV secretory pathway VirD2 relaxase